MPTVTEVELIRDLCKRDYTTFVKEFWHVISKEPLKWNWHMDLLCRDLQKGAVRVMQRKHKVADRVYNISPGSSKSSICSVLFPAWVWAAGMPEAQFICGSHGEDLAINELGAKSRDVVTSDLYRACFPEIVLRDDQNAKGYFKNTIGGYRKAVGSGGNIIGFHGHFIIIDDPIDPTKAVSDAELIQINRWLKETLRGRKVDKSVTLTILVMQRLHQSDPTAQMLKAPDVRHFRIPAELSYKVHPPELAANYVDGLMDPVRLPWKVLRGERSPAGLGEYGYCTPGFTPILMSNWKEKQIQDVEVGDEVVGYTFGIPGKKASIVKSQVVAKTVTEGREVVRLRMASGREVFCTPDHRWWNGRSPGPHDPNRKPYMPPRIGLKLRSVYDPLKPITPREQRLYDWLGGMIDGDGCANRAGAVCISQSPTANPEIYSRIKKTLDQLGIPYTEDRRMRRDKYVGERKVADSMQGGFTLGGGREVKMRLIHHSLCVKKSRIVNAIWAEPGYVADHHDPIVAIEPAGKMTVYSLTTTSGNYVAWGYASKNCGQYGQDPVPSGGGKFKVDKLRIGRPPSEFVSVVRYWDKAGTAGGGAYTVGVKGGIDKDGRLWVLDVVRVQQDSYEREKLIRRTARLDGRGVIVGVEQEPGSGGKESAEGTARRLIGYRCRLLSPRGDKELRAEEFSVQVNGGNVWLPADQFEGGSWVGWAAEYVDELKHFPHSTYKDQCDASSGMMQLVIKGRRKVGGIRRRRHVSDQDDFNLAG